MAAVPRTLHLRRFVMGVFLGIICLETCHAGGRIEIKLKRFRSGCKEHFGASKCDIYFKICLETPGAQSCNLLRQTTGYWEDTSTIDMGSLTDLKGLANPINKSVTSFTSNRVDLSVEVWDKDEVTGDDQEGILNRNLYYNPILRKHVDHNSWTSDYFYSSHHHLWLAYRFYCDYDYYSAQCNLYCRAQNNNYFGHYTCDDSGNKICNQGWTGDSCLTDINECEENPCYYNGTCVNLPGFFKCHCPVHYTGQFCDQILSQCYSGPCRNGGTCTGDMNSFTCQCPPAWTNSTCETEVDFCSSNPCHNNGTCYGVTGNYTCACAVGWTGANCTTQVRACDSAPCRNGASCTNLPTATYACNCTEQYEGDNCQTEKDPCEPNLCQNSGECVQVTYDEFNCSCVEGWIGELCSDYIKVENETLTGLPTSTDEDGFDWWIILLCFLIVLLVVVTVIFAIFYRRRRRQKENAAARMSVDSDGTQIVHVASPDNMAFQNALYNEMNRQNSQIDRRNTPVPPPPIPTPGPDDDDVFYPTKPKLLPDEEQGAVGGTPNHYSEIGDGYLQPAKMVVAGEKGASQTKQKQVDGEDLGLDLRAEAGAAGGLEASPGVNHYADFEELKRRSVAARQTSSCSATTPLEPRAAGVGNPQYYDLTGDGVADPEALQRLAEEQEEAHHYHDLDDVCLQIRDGWAAENEAAAGVAKGFGPGGSLLMDLPDPTPPEDLDTTHEEEEVEEDEGVAGQEDIEALRREVLLGVSGSED